MNKYQKQWLNSFLEQACKSQKKTPALSLEWKYAFIHRANITGITNESTPDFNRLLNELFDSPSSKFLAELKFSPGIGDSDPYNEFIRSFLNTSSEKQNLRFLMLGEGYKFQYEQYVSSIDLLLSQLPALEYLEIAGPLHMTNQPAHSNLKHLNIRCKADFDYSVEKVALGDFPNLETLEISLDYKTNIYGQPFSPFKSLGNSSAFPKLKHLVIKDLGINNGTLDSLIPSPLLERLDTLSLEMKERGDLWPPLKDINNKPLLEHLMTLDLRVNSIPWDIQELRDIMEDRLEVSRF